MLTDNDVSAEGGRNRTASSGAPAAASVAYERGWARRASGEAQGSEEALLDAADFLMHLLNNEVKCANSY